MIEILPGIITSIFLLVVLSYYILLFIKKKDLPKEKTFPDISIIVPAHNEADCIKQCIQSIIDADWQGKKQVIVIDDGSTDNTAKVVASLNNKNIELITKKHTGKSDSINTGLKKANYDAIAVIDADSMISKDSFINIVKEIEKKNTVASTCVIKVENRKKRIGMWLHIEQLYNSLTRYLMSKLNANVVTPGPLSAYRKKQLIEIGGFSTKGFSEDIDVTIRLIRKGYHIGFTDKASSSTIMPISPKGFFRQRTRYTRGIINIFKKHMQLNSAIIDIYTLPIFLFTYIQAIIMGSFTLYQIISGYHTYFFSKSIYFSFAVLKFFFEWFSIVGFVRWFISVILGNTPLTLITMIGIVSTLLSYPLYFYSVFKFDKKFDLWHIIPLFFMQPFWLLIMFFYIISLPEILRKKQYNIWKKNE